jgi:anti-sigma factor RsiW
MIDQDTMLKVQAYVDHELDPQDARAVAALVERDAEAKAVYAELNEVRTLVAANPLSPKLPESREFFWSKIERDIRRSSAEPVTPSKFRWWMRIVAPATGFAVVLMVAFLLLKPGVMPSTLSSLHEIESPLKEANTISFYSPSAGMTVVWVETRDY